MHLKPTHSWRWIASYAAQSLDPGRKFQCIYWWEDWRAAQPIGSRWGRKEHRTAAIRSVCSQSLRYVTGWGSQWMREKHGECDSDWRAKEWTRVKDGEWEWVINKCESRRKRIRQWKRETANQQVADWSWSLSAGESDRKIQPRKEWLRVTETVISARKVWLRVTETGNATERVIQGDRQ